MPKYYYTTHNAQARLFKSQRPLYWSFEVRMPIRKEVSKQILTRFSICRQIFCGEERRYSNDRDMLPRQRHQAACASASRRASSRVSSLPTLAAFGLLFLRRRSGGGVRETVSALAGRWPHHPKEETSTAVRSPPLLSEKVW